MLIRRRYNMTPFPVCGRPVRLSTLDEIKLAHQLVSCCGRFFYDLPRSRDVSCMTEVIGVQGNESFWQTRERYYAQVNDSGSDSDGDGGGGGEAQTAGGTAVVTNVPIEGTAAGGGGNDDWGVRRDPTDCPHNRRAVHSAGVAGVGGDLSMWEIRRLRREEEIAEARAVLLHSNGGFHTPEVTGGEGYLSLSDYRRKERRRKADEVAAKARAAKVSAQVPDVSLPTPS